MSTLRVNNITDTSGGDTNLNVPNTAKVWVNFNGQGTVAIRADFNVSSITDVGNSRYRANFTTAFAAANYSGVFSYSACYIPGVGYGAYGYIGSQTAASFEAIMAMYTTAAGCTVEPLNVNFAFFG